MGLKNYTTLVIYAKQSLSRFCVGKQRICIPTRTDDDDVIISTTFDILRKRIIEQDEAMSEIKEQVKKLDIDMIHNYFRGVLCDHDANNGTVYDKLQMDEDVDIFNKTLKFKEFVNKLMSPVTTKNLKDSGRAE